jgi:hypothetical protein
MVFASSAARASAITSPQEGMITYLKDTNSTEYYSGTAYVAIGGGGGGKVLQVISAATTTNFTNSTTTYGDTGLTATITPSLNTSKVMVIVSQSYFVNRAGNDSDCKVKLLRGATDIVTNSYFGYISAVGASSTGNMAVGSITCLDSPATTSATTYKTQIAAIGAGSVSAQWSGNMTSTITLMEIGA